MRKAKKLRSKTATIVAPYSTDLMMALRWIQLNKALRGMGAVTFDESRKLYLVKVKLKKTKLDVINLIKDRFGSFIRVL